MPTIASTSPPVLMAHLAASTSRIRIGSGGVMLPNHPALVVAEQFALLESLHPGRIDLGVGRAPGTDPMTAAALRRSAPGLGAEDFPNELVDLLGLLGDRRRDSGAWDRFRATPMLVSTPEVVLLGSSGYSAQAAGLLGLPYAFAHHFDVGTAISTLDAVALYRGSFRPSAVRQEPYTIVTAGVLAAETVRTRRVPRRPGASRHARPAHRPPVAADVAGRGGRAPRSRRGDPDAVQSNRWRPPTRRRRPLSACRAHAGRRADDLDDDPWAGRATADPRDRRRSQTPGLIPDLPAQPVPSESTPVV